MLTPADLADELTGVDNQFSRGDTKAGLLLSMFGAFAAAGSAVLSTTSLTSPATVAAWTAVGAFTLAAVLVAFVIRPAMRHRGAVPYGFTLYATLRPDQIDDAVINSRHPKVKRQQLISASRAAVARYQRIRVAVALFVVGLICSDIAAALNGIPS